MKAFEALCTELWARRLPLAEIEDWAVDSIVIDDNGTVPNTALYAHYCAWAGARGMRAYKQRSVTNLLIGKGLARGRNGRGRWWIGFTLKQQDIPASTNISGVNQAIKTF